MTARRITKLLVANRGEIACRIFRTAKRMGIATVAVHSDADARAMHVAMADEAVNIGPAEAARSYLSIAAIIEACRRSGADAVHPGYGFLSERPAFAEALAAAGIVFVGPNPAAIAAMGDKIESKKAAAAAGVSTVPGFLGIIEDAHNARRIADEIGYPVMLKASAGGGGKGMRIAQSGEEVAEGFARARSEAASSFGDDRVFIEKFIENPRHIEIQILGDKHGNVIHLGERECSIQRRNQKVLEEAPSPLLDDATRSAMGAQAVALAQAVGYDSAGTVEFVVGQDKTFYFLEMNTRLQVEHPVTELVTGIDIVEQMLRIAAGAPLPLRQDEVRLEGWAVESRIYAENPRADFMPSTGRVSTFLPPTEGIDRDGALLRIDAGVRQGDEISVYYDPMIAKLISHAPSRQQAIAAQAFALDNFVIEGVATNLSFVAALMNHPRWREARLSTRFIGDEFPDGFARIALPPSLRDELAAVAASLDVERELARRRRAGRNESGLSRMRAIRIGGGDLTAQVEIGEENRTRVTIDGKSLIVERSSPLQAPLWRGLVDGRDRAVAMKSTTNGIVALRLEGHEAEVRVLPPLTAVLSALMPAPRHTAETSEIRAFMPGIVRSIPVTIGSRVAPGDTVAVIEAMKLENRITAEHGGVVEAVHVTEGETVPVETLLVTILPDAR